MRNTSTDDWRANEAGTSVPFWRSLTATREAQSSPGACVLDGWIFVVGGLGRNSEFLRSVEYFTPPEDESGNGYWTVVQQMNQN
ncbi:unnamed protein product [Schistocephalus solidus]|uniref:Kelch repeat-containing protein n=1 Tax=Schistocephalus solidus TaxID=70667 RepID=A0A183STW4_SCHSO|nr:unnamed protein product [Schistocephalus solidus]